MVYDKKEYDKALYKANREKKLVYQKAYVEANREKVAEYQKAYRDANREKRAAYIKDWQKNNPEKLRSSLRRWRTSHPDATRIQNVRRWARKKGAEGTFDLDDWGALCDAFDNCCAYCGTDEKLTVDHVIPLSKGGRNDLGNLLPACLSCNCSKNDTDLRTWLMSRAINNVDLTTPRADSQENK